MYETLQIELILKRDEKEVPEREGDEDDVGYREKLIEVRVLYVPSGARSFLTLGLHAARVTVVVFKYIFH